MAGTIYDRIDPAKGVRCGFNKAFQVGRFLVRTGYAHAAKLSCEGFAATRRRQDRNSVAKTSELTGDCGAHAASGGGNNGNFRV